MLRKMMPLALVPLCGCDPTGAEVTLMVVLGVFVLAFMSSWAAGLVVIWRLLWGWFPIAQQLDTTTAKFSARRIGFALSAVLLLIAAGSLEARWGGGGCADGSCYIQPAERLQLQPEMIVIGEVGDCKWYAVPVNPRELFLYRGTKQLGSWAVEAQYYQPIIGNQWGEKMPEPPVALPVGYSRKLDPGGGVDTAKLRNQGDNCHCTINGKQVGFAALGAALEDDSKKPWLVITGGGREKVLADLRRDHPDFLSRVRVWSVDGKHNSLFDRETKEPLGFPAGDPGIYFASANGTELHSQSGYKTGDLDVLRKKDPDAPKPKPDDKKPDDKKPDDKKPDDKKPEPKKPDVAPDSSPMIPVCCVLGVLGGIALLVNLKGKN